MGEFSLEKVKKSNVNLSTLLDKKLLEVVKSLELQPINITFVKHTDEMKAKNIPPQILLMGHETDKDIKEKLVHITCHNEELLKKFIEKL